MTPVPRLPNRICCHGKELKPTEHLLCNCVALSSLRLKILGRGFFEEANEVVLSLVCLFVGMCNSFAPLFPFPDFLPYPLYYPLILRTFSTMGYCTYLI